MSPHTPRSGRREGTHGRSARRLPDRNQREPGRTRPRPGHAGAHAGRRGDPGADLPHGAHDQGHLRLSRPAAAGTRGACRRKRARQGARRRADGHAGA